MRDKQPTERTVKIELLSQWKHETEFRNKMSVRPKTKETRQMLFV